MRQTSKYEPSDFTALLRVDNKGQLRWRKSPRDGIRVGEVAGYLQAVHGYVVVGVLDGSFLGHHLVWFMCTGEWPVSEIDHKNGVRHDNRFKNLRLGTHRNNLQNCKVRANNKSGFPNVYWDKKADRWGVSIRADSGKRVFIGYFKVDQFDKACAASREAKRQYQPFAPEYRL